MLTRLLYGNKKFISLFVIIVLLIIISAVLSPIVINNVKNNWNDQLIDRVEEIESSTQKIFMGKEDQLFSVFTPLKNEIQNILDSNKTVGPDFIGKYNNSFPDNISIQIYEKDSGLLSWTNNIAVNFEDPELEKFNYGETFFHRSKLITYFTLIDTFNYKNQNASICVSVPLEKNYVIRNQYFNKISISDSLSRIFSTTLEIEYSPGAERTRDGRKTSFPITNNFKNQIGIVTIQKPSLDVELNNVQEIFSFIQSFLAIVGFILIGWVFRKELSKVKSLFARFIIISIYLIAARVLLFVLGIPSKYFEWNLTSSSYFSSTFGFGVVRSPLELFITILVFLSICIIVYKYSIVFFKKNEKNVNPVLFLVSFIIFLIIYLFALRGFGASIRSVIYDSTLRYFKDPSLIPELPAALMHLNVLLLGFCSIIGSVAFIILIFIWKPFTDRKRNLEVFGLVFVVFQIVAVLFDFFQKAPQGTPLTRIIFISLTFLFAYLILFKRKEGKIIFLYFAFAASVISINLLNFYNSQLEKDSLSITAFELVRSNESMLQFTVSGTLVSNQNNEELKRELNTGSSDIAPICFQIWSKSRLHTEAVKSEVSIFDSKGNYVDGFNFRFPETLKQRKFAERVSEMKVWIENTLYSRNKIIRGVIPIKNGNKILGYLEISAILDLNDFGIENIPEFISTKRTVLNSTVDFDQLVIFEFLDGSLINSFGGFVPSKIQRSEIINTDYGKDTEQWFNFSFNKEDYIVYAIKPAEFNAKRIIAVGLKDKNLSWNLFDFFKVFFIHSIIITLFIILFLVIAIAKKQISLFGFRTQLLIAFLIISILPLIFLAIYYRDLTEAKNESLIYYKLGKRASQVESYINDYINNTELNPYAIFDKAVKDLNIDFTLYQGKELIYSSKIDYYKSGLLPEILNPVADNLLYKKDFKEYLAREQVENYKFNSFYYLASLNGENYVIKVNDVFNRIVLPLSNLEVDIFLFGSYSLAVIIIILLSTILANQISSPVRKLTSATKSVAGGDLNVEVPENYAGEIKDLLRGFNKMVQELKRSQTELAKMEREAAWKEMAKQVAHEIKNPLTPMKLAVQQLIAAYKDNSNKFGEIFDKVTNTIINQIETLKNIASEFSHFARMPNLKMEKVNIIDSVNEAADLFIEERAEIEIVVPADKIFISADNDQLKRTFINLIRNSIQAGADKILLKMKIAGDFVECRIIDNGKGFLENEIDKVFVESFTTKIKGSGLGLTMAKRFIENVNGNIKLESTSETGTIILLQFPLYSE